MKSFLRGLVKLVALVLVAGGVGVALGMGLSTLSGDDEPAIPGGTAETRAGADAAAAETTAAPVTAATTSTASAAQAEVRVSVLGARLFTDSTPSGREEQRARITVRIRAENTTSRQVSLDAPTLRVGSVRIPVDATGDQFAPFEPGASQTVTLRFALAGEATPKVVRDRRARILIAGQSLPMRVKVQPPTT